MNLIGLLEFDKWIHLCNLDSCQDSITIAPANYFLLLPSLSLTHTISRQHRLAVILFSILEESGLSYSFMQVKSHDVYSFVKGFLCSQASF